MAAQEVPEANISEGRHQLFQHEVQDISNPEVPFIMPHSGVSASDQLPQMQLPLCKAGSNRMACRHKIKLRVASSCSTRNVARRHQHEEKQG